MTDEQRHAVAVGYSGDEITGLPTRWFIYVSPAGGDEPFELGFTCYDDLTDFAGRICRLARSQRMLLKEVERSDD